MVQPSRSTAGAFALLKKYQALKRINNWTTNQK
jgi:hypothetical protein